MLNAVMCPVTGAGENSEAEGLARMRWPRKASYRGWSWRLRHWR